MTLPTSAGSLHEACYQGDADAVRALLASGVDANAPAEPGGHEWISSAGTPKPLNCVVIAWAMTDGHVEVARLLIEHGAVVDETVLNDHSVEMMGGARDLALHELLLAAYEPR